MSNFQSFVEDRVGLAAYRLLAVPDRIDASGSDHDDYRSMMNLQVLESLERDDFQVGEGIAGYRWVTTLLRNKTIDCKRKRGTAEITLVSVPDIENLPNTSSYNSEDTIIQRDLFKRLRACLAASDWSLLIAYVEHGTVRDTWRASGGEGTERALGRRLERIIVLCRKIIQKIT